MTTTSAALRSILLTATLALASAAHGQSIPVGDAGFEVTVFTPCNFGNFGAASPWKLESGGGGAWRPQTCWEMFAPEGLQVGYLNGGTIKQTLTTTGVAGAPYTLSVTLGRRTNACCPAQPTTLALWAGTRLIDSRVVSVAEAPAPGKWGRYSLSTNAPADLAPGLPLIIRFSNPGAQTDLDQVTLEGGGCAADFDHDGFVTGDDFDKYVLEFTAGNAAADFDHDGFVTGDDFDAFVAAFVAGC